MKIIGCIWISLMVSVTSLWAQPVQFPDRPLTGRKSYYYNTYMVQILLMEDNTFHLCGHHQPVTGIHWKTIPPFYFSGTYRENPPGKIELIDSISRYDYFWVPTGFSATRDVNGNPILTATYSDLQRKTFPYSLRFGLPDGLFPECTVYSDGSIQFEYLYFKTELNGLIQSKKAVEKGKEWPGRFEQFHTQIENVQP
jgi:hypothetical protein